MRTDGLWHPRLMQIVTGLGHTDLIVIADAGLPIPAGVERIDLLWRRGEPGFLPVLRAILADGVFEHACYASELADPAILDGLASALGQIPSSTVSHAELKNRTVDARVIVRTGEATPYANAVLRAGVAF
ncbi:D-ribose pyranase [Nocardia sp. NBC_01503]|uniref:D-ribose pyranase n=1 Tax=Nocardia sp. NBC_01503 TaxID=2975997 RepID=UPI002E7BB04F|nr:D-ribose pyranase [Nocardia sp. NBC_01503]WTL30836.1 D-ribose pyranase [Nocardia sp. NBC_01503]